MKGVLCCRDGEITRKTRDLVLEVTKRKTLVRFAHHRLFRLPPISSKFDPVTNKKTLHIVQGFSLVGMERFELSTSSSRTTRANLAALHPERLGVGVGVSHRVRMQK